MKNKNSNTFQNETNENEFEKFENEDKFPEISTNYNFEKKRKKSKIGISVFVILLAVGVVGNWYWENSSISKNILPVVNSLTNTESKVESKKLGEASFVDATTSANAESDYFTNAKLNRQTAVDKSLEALQKIIDSQSENSKAKENAGQDIARISANITIENKIETLVTAKGVNKCLAIVSDDGGSVEIIVDTKDLDSAMIIKIKEIAMKQLDCTFSNVSIIQSK